MLKIILSGLITSGVFTVAAASDHEIYWQNKDLDIIHSSSTKVTNNEEFIANLQKVLADNLSADKFAFMKEIVPMAVNANEEVELERDFLAKLMKKKEITEEEKIALTALHFKYNTDGITNEENALKELKRRINIVPLDLILTQAALESGWGQAPAVEKCNNLFGIHGNNGLEICDTPSKKIAHFDSIQASVSFHILNLNRNAGYTEFRVHRQKILENSDSLTGIKLMPDLINYSIRKKAYTDELISLDTNNHLLSSVIEALKLTEH
ncbi:MAG: glucosaminidase domain-containing protein [Bacteriovorax sp.]|nr:glucosaminidase domain-containing protein [Bacteriovorax sp.]